MINAQAYALGAERSVIRELFAYGCQRAREVGPENVYDYSLGNPSIPAPPQVNAAIREILSTQDPIAVHGYSAAAGDLAAQAAIAEDLKARFGGDITPEDLFLGCGAAPELTAVFRALAVPGAQICALAPYFPEYKPFVESAGAAFLAVPPDVPGFQLNLTALAQTLTPNTVAVIVNSPNNPAGTVYSEDALKALGALLREKSQQYGHPIYIVSDEPYRELVYDGITVPFIPNLYPDTVVCYSYSKSLSLPGERIGYVYVPKQAADSRRLYAAIAGAARSMGHVCAPSLMQQVIARCAGLRPDLETYSENRRLLMEGLQAMGYEMAKPEGAFYLFVKAPEGDGIAFSQRARELDLLVVPGEGFGCPGYFRLCYCVKKEQILKSLPLFRALLHS